MKDKKFWIGAACSVFFLYLALRKVDFAQLGRELREVRPAFVPGLIAFVLTDLLVRAARWRFLLPRDPKITVGRLFRLEAIGLAINNVLPLRIGELARAYLTSKETGLPLLTVLASIVVERVFDALTLLGFVVFLGDWGGGPIAELRPWARLGFVVLSTLVLGVAWLERHPWSPFKRLPWVGRLVEQAALGARGLASLRPASIVVTLGVLLWLVDGLTFWTAARGMRIDAMGFPLAVMALCAAAAATALPAVPGYFGTYEFAVSRVLVQAGIGQSTAFGLASFVHVLQFLVTTGIGLFFLYREGHTLSTVGQSPAPEGGSQEAAR